MNVSEVRDYILSIQKDMKHFKLSGESTGTLNETLVVMSMKKVHMLSFCPTTKAILVIIILTEGTS